VKIDTQSAGADLSITSMTFQNLTAGATAINFLGGQFISTFTKVAFNDAGIGINVNGSLLDPGSSITMSRYSGVRGGALYENDPLGYVDWGNLPAGCGAGANVSKAGARPMPRYRRPSIAYPLRWMTIPAWSYAIRKPIPSR